MGLLTQPVTERIKKKNALSAAALLLSAEALEVEVPEQQDLVWEWERLGPGGVFRLLRCSYLL